MTEKHYYECTICHRWNDPEDDVCWKCQADLRSEVAKSERSRLLESNRSLEEARRRDATRKSIPQYAGLVERCELIDEHIWRIKLDDYDTMFELHFSGCFFLEQGERISLLGAPESDDRIKCHAAYNHNRRQGIWMRRPKTVVRTEIVFSVVGLLLMVLGVWFYSATFWGSYILAVMGLRFAFREMNGDKDFVGKRFVKNMAELDEEY